MALSPASRVLPLGSFNFWALAIFLALTFFLGGGARSDIQSLVILRPAAVFFCGLALWNLRWEHIKAHRALFGMTVAILTLVIAHLIPLPPTIWGLLPGRAVIAEIDKVAGVGAVWRPISMVPGAAWNALYSVTVPVAVLLLGVQLSREECFKLLPVLLGFGLLSGFWGLMQTIGDPQGPLYLYRITNNGSAVGLFSNRNHQSLLLATLFPMLAVYASAGVRSEAQAKVRGSIAIAGGVVLVPLLLVTGSRAGLVAGLIGLIAAGAFYRKPQFVAPKRRTTPRFDWRYPLAGLLVILLGGITALMSRAEALQRLSAPDQAEEQRLAVWGPIARMAWQYFPMGSGVGSFVEVYQIDEPYALLSPVYLNHAHNDWLEVYLTTGLPGIFLLAAAVALGVRGGVAVFRTGLVRAREIQFGRLGLVIASILALGSIGDYPLRTPTLACVFTLALLWLQRGSDFARKSLAVPRTLG